MEGGGRQQRPSRRRSALISLDSTHVCGSERRGIPGDRRTGRLPGDRKLRLRSHTAAGRKARRDQEDRLRMTEQRIVMLQLHQELRVRKKKKKNNFISTHSADTEVRSNQERSDTSPSLCHRCCCADRRIRADSWLQTCLQDILRPKKPKSSACSSSSRSCV